MRQLACALTTKWQLAKESQNYTAMLQQKIADRTLSLQESLSLIKSTFESSSDGIIIVNNKGRIIDYNKNMVSLLNIPQLILDSKNEELFLEYIKNSIVDSEIFMSEINKLQLDIERTSSGVIKFKSGKVFEYYSQPHRLNENIIGRIIDFRDITKRDKLEKELLYKATHDTLTGLPNRVMLLDVLRQTIKKSRKHNSHFAVLFIDLDRFKLINDNLSHSVGDVLLKRVADRLHHAIRSTDIIGRLGGDEFVIILANIEQKKHIEDKVHKLISIFQEPFEIDGRQITLTASIGISMYPKDGTTMNTILRNADAAMYSAKALRGNNYKFYSYEMNTHTINILDQEMELRQAIQKNEFFLCYQPQIDLLNEKLVAAEALIRWQHPKKGVLFPIDFIPLAEETGLIVPIGEWVLRTACAQNKSWQDAGFPPIRVAINFSAQQFTQHNLVEKVRETLQSTGLEPKYLEIELTENIIISTNEIIRMITELKKLGVIIAIDDFGKGYSGLSYLDKIPLDRLKIDGSFIPNIHHITDDEIIIRAVIAMAKKLKLDVLAEGVETAEQLKFLQKYDCNDVQGFYLSKPLTTSNMENYLNDPTIIKKIISGSSDDLKAEKK